MRPAIIPRNHGGLTLQLPPKPPTPQTEAKSGLAHRGGVIPACPGSRSDATKQQSRTRALMVTAKGAQLLLASIYRAGGSAGGEKGHTVTRATGRA